jgi:hypothetical protein
VEFIEPGVVFVTAKAAPGSPGENVGKTPPSPFFGPGDGDHRFRKTYYAKLKEVRIVCATPGSGSVPVGIEAKAAGVTSARRVALMATVRTICFSMGGLLLGSANVHCPESTAKSRKRRGFQ